MAIERSIIDTAARLRRNREPHLVATVVRVHGSAYRRPGARMLLTQFRWITGSVSGGCLEGDIASKGWWMTRDGQPVLVTYDSSMPQGGEDDDVRSAFGLGCDGRVEVMFERANVPGRIDPLELADRCVRDQKRGAIVTVIRSEVPGVAMGMRVAVVGDEEILGDMHEPSLRPGMLADARAAIATGESCNRTYRTDAGNVDVFVECFLPPPRLFVFGTGHDVVPVVTLAKTLGWDVSVCTSEARVAVRQRFTTADELVIGNPQELAARVDEADRGVAILMSHHYETDRAHLGALVRTSCRYIGVISQRARTTRMLTELDLGIHGDARIHAPIGLDIGANTPQELALAIVAEVQSTLANAPGVPARNRVTARSENPLLPRIAEAVAAATIEGPLRPSDAVPTQMAVEMTTLVAS
jgi:xanthine dehydrogenase accessory factor